MNTLKTKTNRLVITIMLFMQDFVFGVRRRWAAMKENPQAGYSAVEWIVIVLAVLAIAAIVIGAITAFVNAQTAKLP
ncbi:hypothetical protein ACH3VR_21880 [Microbacterium sp. B2969]|uniref:Uncharacterized protein n=1 Tax=Microbacterium alkaliflavum TaxID=3248839 RepID=A0ABW7QDQ6_9MICO